MDPLLVDIFQAYYDARKNKRNTASAREFEIGYERKLFDLYEEIKHRTYTPGVSTCFIVKKPVHREIFAADFRDRIVHHLIFNYLSPIFERYFISDSYSCRTGRGTSYGIKRITHFIRSCSRNYTGDCYILKLDICGYFMAMDKHILYAYIVQKLGKEDRLLYAVDIDLLWYLIRTILFHDPTKNYQVRGDMSDWAGLPHSKSLFYARKNTGLPIGNLTSQLFGNIYMNKFDHFVRDSLGCRYYGRYVDDMVFIDQDREYLKSIVVPVRTYLTEYLKLTLHPKKMYLQHADRGVAFLGVYIKPYRTYIGRRTKHNFRVQIERWKKQSSSGTGGIPEFDCVIPTANSYLGLMKHYQTYRLRKGMVFELRSYLGQHIDYDSVYGKIMKRSN